MADGPGTLELLAQQVGTALQSLESQLTASNVIPFLAQLGLQFPPALTSNTPFMNAVSAAATAAGALTNLLTQLATDIQNGDDAAIVQDGIKIVGAIGPIVSALETIGTLLPAAASGLGIDPGEVATFAGALAENLLSYLLISYLETTQPGALGVANLLGVVDYIPMPGVTGDPTHPPYTIRRLNLSNVGNAISSPSDLIKTLYDWGNPTFDGTKLFPRLGTSLGLLGAPVTVNAAGNALNATYFTLALNGASQPPGVAGTINYALPAGFTLTLPLSSILSIQIGVQGTFDAGIGLTVTPPVQLALKPPTGSLSGQLTTALVATAPDADHPIIIVGQTGGSRMQTTSFSVGAGLAVAWDGTTASADPVLTATIKGGLVVIDTTNADGFLAEVLSGVHAQGAFDLIATWRGDTGLHIQGGAQLEIDLPMHINLGPATLSTLYLVGGLANGALTLEVSAGLGVTLGPIQAAVDRVGLLGTMTFPPSGGNLGFANLVLGFKPPNGLGLAIDAGVVTGGGYISFDPSKGQYSGIIAMTLVDTIGLTVIAVLDTVMPDGSSGFSLLLIITFTIPPIQLGFGFTLTGVGGLAGVNRSMSTSALEGGFLAHTLGAIMFPPDPIANSSQIISDIRSFFPPAQGRYLFGPLLQISWGTPTLLSFSIAAILSVPDPITLALLGLIDGGLPDLSSDLIELHIEVLGIIDFGAKTVSVDGTLYDSRVLEFALGGSLCFRWGWGAGGPSFVFSLGGFNPAFNTDGLNLPPLTRLSISIGSGDNPRISANSYFAVTSNSLQFGANVQAYAAAGGFSISGYLGFDVLFIRSPFSFEFDFQASFTVQYDGTTLLGLTVDGLFSGMRPWHLHASVSISLLFFSVSATIDRSWGDSTQATIPSLPVLPDLFAALVAPASWSAALPPGASAGVSLVTLKPTDTTLRVHPVGTLTVHEHIVPLDLPITRYGAATPADGTEFSIQSVTVNGTAETSTPIQDYFAAGQFETLSDADKLSKPSFESFDAGVTIGSATVSSGQDRPRTVMYQEFYIDTPTGFARVIPGYYKMPANIHLALSAQGAGATSPLKHTGLSKYSAGPQQMGIATQDPPYVVATILDLTVRADIAPGEGTTYLQAQAAVKAYLDANPNAVGTLQIVPLYEIAA